MLWCLTLIDDFRMLTITLQKTYYQIIIFKSIPKVVFLGKNISPFNWIVLEDPVTKNSEKKLVPFFLPGD